MNQELGEFFVKFTTQGLTEVKDAIDDLSKKMDDVGKSTKNATDKTDGFFNKIGGSNSGWIGLLSKLAAAVLSVKSAWDNVANAAASTMTIYNQAMLAGTDPQTLERWQNVARHKGLNASAIFSDFRNGREFLQRIADVEMSDDLNKAFGRANLTLDAVMQSVQYGNLDATFAMLNQVLSARDENGKAILSDTRATEIMNQLGFSDTMLSLLRLQELPTLLENAKLIYTEDPALLEASAKRTEAREILRDTWNSIWANPELINTQTEILNALNQMLGPIQDIAKWCGKWLSETTSTISEITQAWDAVNPEGKTQEQIQTEERVKAGERGAAYGMGLGAAGALAGAKLGVFGGPGTTLLGAIVGGIAGSIIGWLKKADDQGIINGMEGVINNNWVAPMNLPSSESNAVATVNLNGIKVIETRGKNSTTIDMSLEEIPDVAIGG